MAFCTKCGAQHEEGAAFCPSCGSPIGAAEKQSAQEGGLVDQFKNTKDYTDQFDPTDIAQNKALSILSYIGPLVLIPIFCAKHSKFARFHANQGLVVLIASAAAGILNTICGYLTAVAWPFVLLELPAALLSLGITALAVLGIINAARGKAKEVPLIGKIRILR